MNLPSGPKGVRYRGLTVDCDPVSQILSAPTPFYPTVLSDSHVSIKSCTNYPDGPTPGLSNNKSRNTCDGING